MWCYKWKTKEKKEELRKGKGVTKKNGIPFRLFVLLLFLSLFSFCRQAPISELVLLKE